MPGQEFFAETAACALPVAFRELSVKIVWQRGVVDVEGGDQPFQGVEEIEQVAIIAAVGIGLYGPHEKGRAQGTAAELDGVRHPLVLSLVLGPDKRRFEKLLRVFRKHPDAAQISVGGKGSVGGRPKVGKGDLGVVAQFEGAVGEAAFVGKQGELDPRKMAAAFLREVPERFGAPVEGAVQVELSRQPEVAAADGLAAGADPFQGVEHAVDARHRFKRTGQLRGVVGEGLEQVEIDENDAVEAAFCMQHVQTFREFRQQGSVAIEAGMVETAVQEGILFRSLKFFQGRGQCRESGASLRAVAPVGNGRKEKAEMHRVEGGLLRIEELHIGRVGQEGDIEGKHGRFCRRECFAGKEQLLHGSPIRRRVPVRRFPDNPLECSGKSG